jgi:hypothetical protein
MILVSRSNSMRAWSNRSLARISASLSRRVTFGLGPCNDAACFLFGFDEHGLRSGSAAAPQSPDHGEPEQEHDEQRGGDDEHHLRCHHVPPFCQGAISDPGIGSNSGEGHERRSPPRPCGQPYLNLRNHRWAPASGPKGTGEPGNPSNRCWFNDSFTHHQPRRDLQISRSPGRFPGFMTSSSFETRRSALSSNCLCRSS